MAMKGSDLPITIVNHSDWTVTLSGGFVLGVVSDVVNSNVATPDFRRPEFEIRTLYADEFRDCYPTVKSDNFLKIKQIFARTFTGSFWKVLYKHYSVSVSKISQFT